MKTTSPAGQRGGFVMGLVVGLLIGLALALGVALYITKAPIPFMNKVPQRTAEQDSAENERNRTWDPNAPLGGKAGQRSAGSAAAAAAASAATAGIAAPTVVGGSTATPPAGIAAANVPAAPAVPRVAARDPSAILDGATPAASVAAARPTPPMLDPFIYFVQAGAYTRTEDAEQQRARLAMLGQAARITEREQAGRVVYRVRLGPFTSRDAADTLQNKLQEQSIEAQIVRVEKP